jgi:hypothetical protein
MMTRGQVIALQLSFWLTTLTGAVFAYMRYAMKSEDPFAAANHPWQPTMLAAHVVVAPFLVFALGWIFGNHIWPAFVRNDVPHRKSGIAAMAMIVPMTLSAYLLQIATSDALRQAMAAAHWISSALFVIAYVAHLVFKPKRSAMV